MWMRLFNCERLFADHLAETLRSHGFDIMDLTTDAWLSNNEARLARLRVTKCRTSIALYVFRGSTTGRCEDDDARAHISLCYGSGITLNPLRLVKDSIARWKGQQRDDERLAEEVAQSMREASGGRVQEA